MVVLQKCTGFMEGGTSSCIETRVECVVDGTEEVNIKAEEAIDMKDEIPEAVIFPSINTELEVSLWGVWVCVCVRWWQLMLLGHILP